MGNYTQKMNSMEILRDPFESKEDVQRRRLNMFGNPYRRNARGGGAEEEKDGDLSLEGDSASMSDDSLGDSNFPSTQGSGSSASVSSTGSSTSSRISLSSFSTVRRINGASSMKRARLRSTSPSIERQASTPQTSRVISRVKPLSSFKISLNIPDGGVDGQEYDQARLYLPVLSGMDDPAKSVTPSTPSARSCDIGWVKNIDEQSIMEEVVAATSPPPAPQCPLVHGDGIEMILPYADEEGIPYDEQAYEKKQISLFGDGDDGEFSDLENGNGAGKRPHHEQDDVRIGGRDNGEGDDQNGEIPKKRVRVDAEWQNDGMVLKDDNEILPIDVSCQEAEEPTSNDRTALEEGEEENFVVGDGAGPSRLFRDEAHVRQHVADLFRRVPRGESCTISTHNFNSTGYARPVDPRNRSVLGPTCPRAGYRGLGGAGADGAVGQTLCPSDASFRPTAEVTATCVKLRCYEDSNIQQITTLPWLSGWLLCPSAVCWLLAVAQ